MHLDQEKLQRALDGELQAEEALAVGSHLRECAACRSSLQQAGKEEREVLGLLTSLDHPTPELSLDAIRSRSRGQGHRWGRWAAGVVLALGITSAAYALPGSPLPALVRRIAHGLHSEAESPGGGLQEAAPVAPMSGIAVQPGDFLAIRFSSFQARGEIRVEFTDQPEVAVRAMGGSPTFTSDPDRLLIENAGSDADFEIEISRAASQVEILVGGRLRFSWEGGRVRAGTPADEEGRFLISLQPGEA